MNILISIPCLLTGGTEFQTLNLVKALKSANHTVIVCCYFEYLDKMVDLFSLNGAEVVLFSNKNKQRPSGFRQISFLYANLKKLVVKFKPNIVHVQYMAPGALPIFILKLLCVKKIIATVHQPYTRTHGTLAKILLQTSAKLCIKFIVVSKNAEKSWFGSSALFNEKISLEKQPKHITIYNAVDVSKIQEIEKSVGILNEKLKHGIPENKFIFGAVSRLRKEKGIDLLIKAFSKLVKEVPDIHLHLVGNGPEKKKLNELVKKFDILQYVTFFGEADWQIAMQQMVLMDVVVVPSRFEGFGLTAAEAMAIGKPVVASNVFGLKEVVNDTQTGFLFESENSEDLYLKLKLVCEHKSNYNHLSEAAINAVRKFGLSTYYKKVTTLHSTI